jgi:hypothetical protein
VATASAAVAGLQVVSGESDVATSFNKGTTIGCPAGKQVLGAGGDLTGGASQVMMDDITPNAALTQVTVFGAEDGSGFAGNWTVTAFAICATPVPGLQRVAATSPTNSSNKGVTASCPVGKRVLGAGGDITGGAGQVLMHEIRPNSALTSVTVHAFEDENGTTANWTLRAYAICANP